MREEQKKAAKERIFEAALSLFARKGYHAVGIREIAKVADVNISMINYYFGGKAGILRTIIDECYDKYFHAVKDVGDESTPLEEHVRLIVRSMVKFFRENTELAIVAFDAIPLDIPEILDLKVKWATGIHEGMKGFHSKLGIDRDDSVHVSIGPQALLAIVYSHFQSAYAAERSPQLRQYALQFDDAFYERFSEALATQFLYGLKSIVGKDETTKGGSDVQ